MDNMDIQQRIEFLKAIASAENLAGEIDTTKLTTIGHDVLNEYEIDLKSMQDWLDRMEKALNLAQMVKKQKTYPFQDASNVIFPLVTSSALQYNARAYPAIVPSGDVMQCQVHGDDKDGSKAARGQRVSTYASFQLKKTGGEWERDTDSMLMQLPIVGTMFRKMWYDPAADRIRSRIILPGDFVVNNAAQSLETAPRGTEVLRILPHDIETRIRSGWFIDFDYEEHAEDKAKPVKFLEQHRRIDLDDDGYPEPYVVTIHEETKKVVRLVAAFDLEDANVSQKGEILQIDTSPYYVHYEFMPSIDGGFFGTGLGLLLGDISDTINTTINQIIDAGHFQSLGGGFIGARDFRIKGGALRLSPGEWKSVNVHGAAIRESMVPLNPAGPSPVLFQMLGMLIDSGREIASVQDVMTGDVQRQNMPVGTTLALIEQGMMVFTASYKRIYRSLADEFALLAKLNQKYLDPRKYMEFHDEQVDPKVDFDLEDMDITPVADPRAVTSMQSMGRAQALLDLADKGLVDRGAVTLRVLEAMNIDDIEALMPQPDPMQQAMQEAQMEMTILDIDLKKAEITRMLAQAEKDQATAVKGIAEAESEESGRGINEYRTALEGMKNELEIRRQRLGIVAGKSGNGMDTGPAPAAGQTIP
jgi:chaperonin GroES